MALKTFKAPNISCEHCAMTIKRELGELPGVSSVSGDAESKTVTVEWDEAATKWDAVLSKLIEIGYPPEAE